jgi:hypothetical protein
MHLRTPRWILASWSPALVRSATRLFEAMRHARQPLDSVQPARMTAWSVSERSPVLYMQPGVLGKATGGGDRKSDTWKQIHSNLPNSLRLVVRACFMSECRGHGRCRRLRSHCCLHIAILVQVMLHSPYAGHASPSTTRAPSATTVRPSPP